MPPASSLQSTQQPRALRAAGPGTNGMTMKMPASRTVVASLYALVALVCATPPPVAHAASDDTLHVASMRRPAIPMKAAPGATRRPHASDEWMPPRPPRPSRARRQASPAASADPPSCHARPVMTMRAAASHSNAAAKQRCMRCSTSDDAQCRLWRRAAPPATPETSAPSTTGAASSSARSRCRHRRSTAAASKKPSSRNRDGRSSLGPIPQRAAQPVIDGRAETLLRPVDQRGRHVPVEQPAQQRLRLPFRQTHRRHAPRELTTRDDRGTACAFRGSRPSPRDRLSRGCRSAGT